ncbi:MAG: Fe-S cluster assembly sulfur transfer protein SufU [Verrucomicrobiota bacterium]
MEELAELYQEIILSHNKRPRNAGELDEYTGQAEGYNPLCGDHFTIYVKEGDEGLIDEVRFSGDGCAISTASASMMTEAVKGKTRAEVEARIAEVAEMLTSKEEPVFDLETMGELGVLAGVRRFPARIKCATLAWHALAAALKGGETVTTE